MGNLYSDEPTEPGRTIVSIRRVVPDIQSERFDESRDFYVGLLGFEVGMEADWV
jgi:hypothetical protein